ncbi:PAS domain S-box protein [Polaromonas sp.]|uniref:PAS domain-containing sensor histidine kinase n=1 Tax=Polaromonas sp. TaxID=1869339 RepID=UPI0026006D9A|nr:PAS domain S-box protein [Polaromonas sp.]
MIHHREQLARPLNDSGQLSQALAANVREGVAVFDHDLRLVLWNPCLEKVTGLAMHEVLGKQVLDLFASSQGLEIDCNLQRAMKGESFSLPAMLARTSGQARVIRNRDARMFDESDLVWAMLAYSPWRDDEGAIAGVIVVVSDRTERVQAKRKLNDTWSRSQAVINHMLDGMAMVSSEGHIESFNLAAERSFGYRAKEVIGQNVLMLFLCPFTYSNDCTLEQCLVSGKKGISGVGREVLGLRKDQSTFPLELVVSKIALRGGHLFTVLLRDISTRKAAQEELGVITERLRQLAAHQESVREAERSRIARELHDELGGQLTALRFDVNRLSQLPGIGLERVGQLRDSLDAAIRSTRSIISDLRPPMLDHLGLWGAIEWYAEGLARRCALNCQILICPNLEDLKMSNNVGISLFRVVQEALSNIVKHAEAQSIILRAKRLDDAVIEVKIIDDGKGLNREDLDKTGHWGVLGMHERVRSLGGELALEGAPGQGTTLRIRLRVS